MSAPRVTRARSMAGELAGAFERAASEERARAYPLAQFRTDPAAYVRERLREPHVMPHQADMLQALADGIAGVEPARVACRSGQKSGKTKTAVWAALWFFECFAGARVFLTAAIEAQTKAVMWHELAQTIRSAEGRGVIIDGKLAASPAGGLVSLDGSREIRGVSGREIEAVAGLSGELLTIIDEASHLPEAKFQAFQGNTMGGGALFFISNPTRNVGPFYDAFHEAKEFWQTFHVDSEAVAKWQASSGTRIPYVATLAKIEEFREMYGEDSPFWALRVKGEWLRNETGRINPMFRIQEAIARWASCLEEGLLSIGYDVAGPSDRGDEHAWAMVRGGKCIAIHRRRGLSEDAAIAETYAVLAIHRRDGEIPRLVVDSEGPIGWAIADRLQREANRRDLEDPHAAFACYAVKASSKHVRDTSKFERVRDELFWVLKRWLEAGAIPNDPKLQGELYAPEWTTLPNGLLKATSKETLQDMLKRSPDSADALALAVHFPIDYSAQIAAQLRDRDAEPAPRAPDVYTTAPQADAPLDPYEAQRSFDPYGGAPGGRGRGGDDG